MKTKFFLYARKSTEDEERQVMSIEAQLAEWAEFAKRESIEITETFIESKSAKKPGREIFNQMMSKVQESKAPVGLLAWHPLCQHQHLILVLIVLFNLFPDESNIPV